MEKKFKKLQTEITLDPTCVSSGENMDYCNDWFYENLCGNLSLKKGITLDKVREKMIKLEYENLELKMRVNALSNMLRQMEVTYFESGFREGHIKTYTFQRDLSIEEYKNFNVVFLNGKVIFHGDKEIANNIFKSGRIDIIGELNQLDQFPYLYTTNKKNIKPL